MGLVISTAEAGLDYPHYGINGIGCDSCHFVYGSQPSLLPPWTEHDPQNIDDTQYNTLCLSCHNDIDAPYVRTHSSIQTDDGYGTWTVECRVCHNPHFHMQFRTYGSAAYLYSDASTNITASTITRTGAGWTVDAYKGFVVIPNILQRNYNYKIIENSQDTLTVQGPIDLTRAASGNTFAIVYNKLIYDSIDLSRITISPAKSGTKAVRFFGKTGTNSFADGDATYDGICEVCHTQTTHFRNNGSGEDQLHVNAGSPAGTDCISCHSHTAGFAHGGAGGTGCEECHGHDPGYGGVTGGKGTYGSHSTHTENDADDLRGPNVGCDTCHEPGGFPLFKSGTDLNGDGRYSLAETDVCDDCHSPDGAYDGVNDPELGARFGNEGELKYNWRNRIYNADGLLKSGKEKWCATCHDEVPSLISGVNAPNVIGDEGAETAYGTGYGYYSTGHGISPAQHYPSSGGTMFGAGLKCDACHDFSGPHIDGLGRTYSQPGTPAAYQQGYRLKSIRGGYPLQVPRSNLCPWEPGYNEQPTVDAADFSLCFSCHDSSPFTDSASVTTNFRNESSGVNAHYYHLSVFKNCGPGPMWASDWSSTLDSRITCMSCHNVHGSTRLSMVRDGKLINREPGLQVAYYNDDVSYVCGGPSPYPPTPADVTLPESTGTVWNANVGNVCWGCHGSCGFNVLYTRTPFAALAPYITEVYGRSGGSTLAVHLSEGVYSNPGLTGDLVPGDFAIIDADDGRSILNVSHTAGDSAAKLTVDTPFDSSNDIGTDMISAANGSSIYNSRNIAMDINTVMIEDDQEAPLISAQDPSNGAGGVAVDDNITFTLSDGKAGLDWSTFVIQLSGDKGYSRTYTDTSVPVVSKTGPISEYNVTIDSDTDFSLGEVITVTVYVNDLAGNSLLPPAWSFNTASGATPHVLTLHPSGLASNPGGYWTVPGSDQWASYLDSNDGNSTYVTSNTGSQGAVFSMDMDDPAGLEGTAIQSISFHVYARYVSGWSPSPPAYPGVINIGYKTGTNTVWKGDTSIDGSGNYNLVSSVTYTTDSDGGPLDINDINDLQIAVQRKTSGGYPLRITEVFAEITYLQ
ncbi:MAG: Ig-like domain-containing protein [Nitrospirota bacterium]